MDEENCSHGANGEIGVEMFSRKSLPRYTKQTVTVNGQQQEVYVYNEEGKVYDAANQMYRDDDESRRNTLYTLGNVEINEAVLKDESILPMTTKTGDADFDRAFAMVDAWTQSFAKLNPYTADVDYQTYYTQLIGSVANLGSIYKAAETALDTTTSYLDNQRQKVAGVSSDDELTNMIRFQSAYNASSRYFTVVSDMLEYLVSQLGSR